MPATADLSWISCQGTQVESLTFILIIQVGKFRTRIMGQSVIESGTLSFLLPLHHNMLLLYSRYSMCKYNVYPSLNNNCSLLICSMCHNGVSIGGIGAMGQVNKYKLLIKGTVIVTVILVTSYKVCIIINTIIVQSSTFAMYCTVTTFLQDVLKLRP